LNSTTCGSGSAAWGVVAGQIATAAVSREATPQPRNSEEEVEAAMRLSWGSTDE
jgi:hypothetical protein